MSRLLWTQRANFGPPERNFHAMVYQTKQQRVLLWGGLGVGDKGRLGDTWEWDGTSWSQVADMGPAGSGAMAYDEDRAVVVLLDQSRNTWEWNGGAWTQVGADGPAVTPGAMAYESGRKRTVVFEPASSAAAAPGRTSEWDGVAWTQVADTGPASRSEHAVVRDDVRNQLVLFGGQDNARATIFRDTWTWNGQAWQQQASFGPAARAEHAMSFDISRARVVLFGGVDSAGRMGDTWDWDGARWVQLQDIGPTERNAHGIAYDAARKRTVLFGGTVQVGAAGRPIADTWELGELP